MTPTFESHKPLTLEPEREVIEPVGFGDGDVAVVGVGNPIMGDDGLGKRVIDELREMPGMTEEDVVLAHAGTTAFFALEAIDGCAKAIIIDAISTGDAPGTIHTYQFVDGAFIGDVPEITMHDFSFVEALEAGRSAYDIPDELLIYGVEPERIEATMKLSETVERAIPTVIELVRDELEM